MKPLICPQCGGNITEYSQWQKVINCQYCSTRFIVGEQNPAPVIDFEPSPNVPLSFNSSALVGAIAAICILFGGIIVFTLAKRKPKSTPPTYPVYKATPVTPQRSPVPESTPDPNQLQFGGKGTANGLFQDASAIAVDRHGRIYVADDTLRVQQFNAQGEFLNVWQIPSSGKYYKKARTIQKIAVDDKDRLFVLVGGVLQIWEQNTIELPEMTYEAAPDYIVDFALRSDGGVLLTYIDDQIETLAYLNRNGKVTRRVEGFHTNTADAALSPRATGLAAIRLATDGAGNIFSVYAFGDLGSYQLSYDTQDLVIFRFTPDGKYVDKFVQTMNSCGIAIDNQSRVYISDEDQLKIYTSSGDPVATVPDLRDINAFALDRENNIYVLGDDKVVKRPAIK